MEPFILLWLAQKPSHGYGLARMAAVAGFRRAAEDPSVLYKVLRSLERQGLLASTWSADADEGARRRTYRLTAAGEGYLHERAEDLARQSQRLAVFVEGYRRLFPEHGDRLQESG